jgi:prepilin-type processing-associated H-X9-DG protein
MIRFSCECGKRLQAREQYAGQVTRCPDCGKEVSIPELSEGPAHDDDAGEESMPQAGRKAAFSEREPEWEEEKGPVLTSGKAVASLILGIASFLCSFLTGIPAIILGILGLRDIGRGQAGGQGLAITGIVTGGLGTLLICPALLLGLLLPAVQKVREAANRMSCQNNLKQIALGLLNYHDRYGRFPPPVVRDSSGKPLHSWRVAVLPFVGEESLYKEFHLDEPWDSDHNRQLLERMPRVYAEPMEGSTSMTVYQVFTGPRTAFEDPRGQNLASFTDGPANTLLVVESARPVRWTEPIDPALPLANRHNGAFNAAFADGSVRSLQTNIDEQVLRALVTRNGGEVVQLSP